MPDAPPRRPYPYRALLALEVAVLSGVVLYRILAEPQRLPYPHFLVDYSHGFLPRALIGQLVSLVLARVPLAVAHGFGALVLLAATLLYLCLFRRDLGIRDATLPVLVFGAGSHLVLRNHAYILGNFDTLGLLACLVALLVPAGSAYPALVAGLGAGLVLAHPGHTLLTLPTLGGIAALRYLVLAPPGARGRRPATLVATLVILAAVLAVAMAGHPSIPREAFVEHMRTRALAPFYEPAAGLWYTSLETSLAYACKRIPRQLAFLPHFAVLLLLHLPLAGFLREVVGGLEPRYRRGALAWLALVTGAHLSMVLLAVDWSRWVASWATCMVLAMHALLRLPRARKLPEEPISTTSGWVFAAALLVATIPVIGVRRPLGP